MRCLTRRIRHDSPSPEIYANRQAYEAHVKSPHFLAYKNGTLHMVTSLELVDVDPLLPELKIK